MGPAAEARTSGGRKSIPGHLLALCIGLVLVLLGIAAGISGEAEPAKMMLGMGIGTNFGAGIVALAVRRAEHRLH